MKMKRILTALLAGPLMWAFAAQAGTTTFKGVSVDYGGASTNWVDGELVLTYAGDGQLTLGGTVRADILAVGGGGAGGTGKSSTTNARYGNGGNGGEVVEIPQVILPSALTIKIGAGGTGSTTSNAKGGDGNDTTVESADGSFVAITAKGGAGGAGNNTSTQAKAGLPTQGVTSEIDGKTYGKGGAKFTNATAQAGDPNTGNGGQGGRANSTAANRKGGDGGSGIVIVRLTDAYNNTDATLKDVTLGVGEEIVDFAEQTTGAAVDIIYSEVVSTSFDPEGVAQCERTKDGKLKIVGAGAGTTTATIVLLDDAAKKMTTYTVNVTVNPSIALQGLTIQRGETSAAFALQESGDAITFDSSDVKDVKFSLTEIAERVETPDGKVGIVGKRAGTTEMTIIKPGLSYVCTVTVSPLITGLYRAGAYEVAVTNASEVKYVDGDLVITYLDTTAAEKSFTLPQPTTPRFLAVGGGGAGGQDSAYSTSAGLPGGGGAGGMVTGNSQEFAAATYTVKVGAGGVAPRSATKRNGANGDDSSIARQGATALATAKGGGGGGARSVGNSGGCGGGGSYSGGSKNGGSGTSGQGNAGGKGGHAKFGAGGGGAGDSGGNTKTSTIDDGSGAGGKGVFCDITGENLEYARGGDGGVPHPKSYYYYKNGVKYLTDSKTDKNAGSNKIYFLEPQDGKPGRNGFGDGGGGGGHYGTKDASTEVTFAGSGGDGIVVVRIPKYTIEVEDALKAAFADQPVTVSDRTVTLTGDIAGPVAMMDNLGAVTIELNGHAIVGANGADGDDITPGGDGQPALKIVPHEYDCESGVTILSVTDSGSLKGGNGGKGYPGGAGAQAVAADGFSVTVADGIGVTAGTAGESYAQHPHKWAYTVKDDKIVAYCVAEDGEPCSYRDQSRGPFVAVSAADASYTAMRYDELTAINGITPVTGVVIAPETYVGRDGTDYPESSTPPREQGAYTVSMQLGDLRITSDFTITEPKSSQDSVYQAWKTAERKGRDVQICLSATFDGSKAINDGNVLFLGSRCNAHSMATGTVEKSINAMTRYANVRWYAYGSSDPTANLVNQLTVKGEKVAYTENGGKVADETVHLEGGNHFVHKEMMDDLYAELVEKRNLADGYDLVILEFDGDLLCRNGASPYQLVYSLPTGWTEEKAAQLRAAMSRYYAEDRVVWIVPDVNQPKSDPGYTGEYPWTSNPEFIWQRAFLNATETNGYKCPLQKNYEDADSLVNYLQEVLVGHFFSNAIIEDTLANGLTIKKVTPQMRAGGGIWRNFEGTAPHYTIPEPRSGTTVKADVEQVGRKVAVTFDMKGEQAWACEHDQVIGDDFRVVIDAELDGFFSGVGEGGWQETNEGPATFTFTESNLEDDEEDFTITIEKDSPKIQNVKLTPDYTAEDVVKTYDGIGTNIVVKPIAPTPEDAIIRYSLDEHGAYTDNFALTNVCEKTKVWFEITDKNGEFNAATNFATVTILPRVVVEQAEDATKAYDGTALTQPAHSNVLSQAIIEAEKMYPGQGASAAGFVPGEGFANVPMTDDSQQTEIGSHPNTIDKTAVTVNEQTDKNNYVFIYLPGTLTVTPSLPMGIAAVPAEKFYDAEPTNITWVVTNATGGVISDATITLREKGTDPWIPAADFAPYVDTTNVTVQVLAEKAGFDPVEAEATVLIKPRPVTLVAGNDSKVYDGTPLTCDDFTVKEGTAPEYGFVGDEGVASVTMTDESTITDPGSKPNVIAGKTAKGGAKLDRNYVVTTEPGTLTVTAAAMGIQAFDAEKFYDAEATNVTWVVTNAAGAVITDATIKLREKGTTEWIPAADFVPYVDTTNVIVQVRAEKAGFTAVEAEATVAIKPRPVTLVAGSDSKVYDGTPLTCDTFTVKVEETTEGYGFVNEEGVASVTMTDESTITDPGTQPNVIAGETAKDGTKLGRNYTVTTEPGTLTVTAATMGIQAFPVEKFYDAEATNVTWVVTNAAGAVITDATIKLREKGTTAWIPVADFAQYVDVTNVTVQVRAEKAGFSPVTAEATLLVKPRPVTLVAGSDSKVYDGTPLTCDDFEVKDDDTTAAIPGYGFVVGEGVASVTMTDESTITDPGSKPNVIASKTAKDGTKLGRNYVVSTEPGTLTVTAAAMGIQAFDAEKFYDAEATNISYVVTNAAGAVITDATISLREKGTDAWIPAADFVPYVDATNVIVQVRADNAGFASVEAEATLLVKPRPVTLVAGSDSKVYDGTPLTCDDFEVKDDDTTAAIPGYGFVNDEGVASVTMTPESTITDPGSQPNVIASETAKAGTKLERNYVVSTEPGELTVTAATMGIAAFPVEKFYDAEATNITWVVTNSAGAVISDATISLREKGTDVWISPSDFQLYIDATNVTVEVRAEKDGYTSVETEAELLVKPRPVTLVAGSAEKAYDGTPLTCDTFAVKEDETTAATPGYGFVNDEGVASVTMTPESTITDPGSKSNKIASETAKDGTKLERNYVVTTEPGTLTVTAAAMGIAAFPVEKFYDAEPTNITWVVTNATGAAITPDSVSLRVKGTDPWIPVADFAQYVDTTNVTVEVKAEKAGFTAVTAEATVLVKPRPVTLVAGSAEKVYDGTPLTCDTFTVKEDTAAEGYGFVGEEGVASVTMTPDSAVADPGSVPNVIASETAKDGTKLDRNYVVSTEPGTLTVTDAAMGIAAFPVEKFYDAEPTNISYVVTNATGAVITDATISLREKGTDPWVPAADFARYVDTTNVIVEVKAEKTGFTSVTAEATVLVKPRPVTLVAGNAEKVYDGTPLTCNTFTVKEGAAPEYGFVGEEGVASVTMTGESTITLPGSKQNEIASETAKAGTKLERNYVVSTEPGTLTVAAAETLTVEAFGAEKFYNGAPTNVTFVAKVDGVPIGDATVSLREKGMEEWIPATEFIPYVNATNVIVEVKAVKTGYAPATAEAIVFVKPRIVVHHAKDGEWEYDGNVHAQPEYFEDEDEEERRSKEEWGTDEVLADSIGFVDGEGYAAELVMTADSAITEPGTTNNVIDRLTEKTALSPNTRPENYKLYYLDGTLTVWQREEEVRRDPEEQQKIEEMPEDARKKIEEADEKLVDDLKQLEEQDVVLNDEPYVKYQLTVTPREKLTEKSRTTPEMASADVAAQEALAPSADKSVYVDITLERTTDKDVVKATDDGDYDKTKWEPLDDADAHGRTEILAVTIPLDVPDGMELSSVTRSCRSESDPDNVDHHPLTKIPPGQEGTTEGFVYDPETKTVTLYARDFCVFGFHLKKKNSPPPHCGCDTEPEPESTALVYQFEASAKTTIAKKRTVKQECSDPVTVCYLAKGSRRFAGIVFTCEPKCDDNAVATAPIQYFWDVTRRQKIDDAELEFNTIERIGNGAKRVALEGLFTAELMDLRIAGFGTYSQKSGYLKSASGYFAGVLDTPVCGIKCSDPLPAIGYTFCEDEEQELDVTPAYGSWRWKYNEAASRKQAANINSYKKLLPSYYAE